MLEQTTKGKQCFVIAANENAGTCIVARIAKIAGMIFSSIYANYYGKALDFPEKGGMIECNKQRNKGKTIMTTLQRRIMQIAARHDLQSSTLPNGRVLVESQAVYKRDVYTMATPIGTTDELLIFLGY